MSFVYKKRLTAADWINYFALCSLSLICIFPFIYIFSVSFTDPAAYVPLKFYLFPPKWSLDAYKYILSTQSFINSIKSTFFITLVGTVLQVRLGLLNSYWSLIWPNLTNAWTLIVVKSFLDSLPPELEESAKMDGSNDVGIFFKIVIPLSMPAIAAFTLFFAVSQWNIYFNALIYISDANKWTLQVLIKALVLDSTPLGTSGTAADGIPPLETVRMAAVTFAMAPILIVYPFLQKYFAKGVMLGSIKG